jgi:hypothetical protein
MIGNLNRNLIRDLNNKIDLSNYKKIEKVLMAYATNVAIASVAGVRQRQ